MALTVFIAICVSALVSALVTQKINIDWMRYQSDQYNTWLTQLQQINQNMIDEIKQRVLGR